MGLAEVLRQAAPMLQMATASDGESNLDLLRRLAVSRIARQTPTPQLDPIRKLPVDPGMSVSRGLADQPQLDIQSSGRTDELAPYQGPRPQGTFAGDAPSLEMPTAPRDGYAVQPQIASAEATRPRRVLPVTNESEPVRPTLMSRDEYSRLVPPDPPVNTYNVPFGSSGEPFGSARPRRTQPRDYAADDAAYLRDLERMPVERSRLKSAGLLAVRALGVGPGAAIGAGLVGLAQPELYGEAKKSRDIGRARRNLASELEYRKTSSEIANKQADLEYRTAQTDYLRTQPDLDATKAATQRRQTLAALYNRLPEFDPQDPANGDMVSAMKEAGLPVIPKSRSHQLRFVQDARTGEWKVIAGDRSTGEGTAQSVTTPEGAPVVTTPTAQIGADTQDKNRASRERIAGLNRESREAIAELNRRARESGGRGDARAEARLTRAIKEITDLENLKTDAASGPVQSRAAALEKATTKAAEIRRLYGDVIEVGYNGDSEGRQWPYAKMKQQGAPAAPGGQQPNVIGRAPAGDGKHHYTSAEIRAQAEASGISFESLYNKLKANRKVVIDQ
jgi:hypothetical protein